MPRKFFQIETQAGAPIEIQRPNDSPLTVTPYAKALTFHTPFFTWLWNRPSAVELHDGQDRARIPIPDITRIIQLGAIGLNLLFIGTALFQSIVRRKAQDGDRKQ